MRDLVSSLGVSVSNSLRLPVAFYEVLSLTFAQLRVSDSLTVNRALVQDDQQPHRIKLPSLYSAPFTRTTQTVRHNALAQMLLDESLRLLPNIFL